MSVTQKKAKLRMKLAHFKILIKLKSAAEIKWWNEATRFHIPCPREGCEGTLKVDEKSCTLDIYCDNCGLDAYDYYGGDVFGDFYVNPKTLKKPRSGTVEFDNLNYDEGNVIQTARIIQSFLKEMRPSEIYTFAWLDVENNVAGHTIIAADKIEIIDLSDEIKKRLNKYKKRKTQRRRKKP